MTIKQLSDKIHENAVQKGFYDKFEKLLKSVANEPELVKHVQNMEVIFGLTMTIVELSEAVNAIRNSKYSEILMPAHFDPEVFEEQIKDTLEDEIADAFIRLIAVSKLIGMDIEKHIEYKLNYNLSRPYNHGKQL